MRIYLSGSWSRRAELAEYALILREHGYIITSSWLSAGEFDHTDDGITIDLPASTQIDLAGTDWREVQECDVFIAFTEQSGSVFTRGGRHVEYGIALSEGKKIIVVGPVDNMFYELADYKLATFNGAVSWLRTIEVAS